MNYMTISYLLSLKTWVLFFKYLICNLCCCNEGNTLYDKDVKCFRNSLWPLQQKWAPCFSLLAHSATQPSLTAWRKKSICDNFLGAPGDNTPTTFGIKRKCSDLNIRKEGSKFGCDKLTVGLFSFKEGRRLHWSLWPSSCIPLRHRGDFQTWHYLCKGQRAESFLGLLMQKLNLWGRQGHDRFLTATSPTQRSE